jgi:hypothetical protein
MKFILIALLVAVGVYLVVPIGGVIMRSYNHVSHDEQTNFESFAAKYINNDGVTNTNIFVGLYEPNCKDKIHTAAFIGAQRHTGVGIVVSVASLPAEGFPVELSSCAQVLFYKAGSPITSPDSVTLNLDHTELTQWEKENMRTNIKIINGFNYPVKIFWNDENSDGFAHGVVHEGDSIR